jgi:hypothetical protein
MMSLSLTLSKRCQLNGDDQQKVERHFDERRFDERRLTPATLQNHRPPCQMFVDHFWGKSFGTLFIKIPLAQNLFRIVTTLKPANYLNPVLIDLLIRGHCFSSSEVVLTNTN